VGVGKAQPLQELPPSSGVDGMTVFNKSTDWAGCTERLYADHIDGHFHSVMREQPSNYAIAAAAIKVRKSSIDPPHAPAIAWPSNDPSVARSSLIPNVIPTALQKLFRQAFFLLSVNSALSSLQIDRIWSTK
jgi:hypothetical protein